MHTETDKFLMVPLEGCLSVLPPEEVEKLRERVAANLLSDAEAQDAASDFFSKTLSFSFDKAGRVMLTPEICAEAGIDKAVVLTGSLNKFNLYSPEQWARAQAANAAQKPGDRLRRFGI